jgi:hypothetical protein
MDFGLILDDVFAFTKQGVFEIWTDVYGSAVPEG